MRWFDPPREKLSDVTVVLTYYPEDDEAYMTWAAGSSVDHSVEVDGVYLNYDADDRLISIGLDRAMSRLPADVLANAQVCMED